MEPLWMKILMWFMMPFSHLFADDPKAMFQIGGIETDYIGRNFLFGARHIAEDHPFSTGGRVVASLWECPYTGDVEHRTMQREVWWHVGYAVKVADSTLYGLFYLN